MSQTDVGNIVVVGSLNLDLVLHMSRIPVAGETLASERSETQCGGKGGNQAVACARLGAKVTMIGALGNDPAGTMLRNALAAASVDCRHVAQLESMASGTAVIALTPDGENRIMLSAGANGEVLSAQLDAAESAFAQANVVVCQCEIPLATVRDAMTLGVKSGAVTILNAAPAQSREVVLNANLLANVDYLVVNETEAQSLSGIDPVDAETTERAARALQAKGAGVVIVTLGAKGAALLEEGRFTLFPALPADVVDTTGAGDTFVGGLAVALASAKTAELAVRYGLAAAAWCVARAGTQQAMPTVADLA